MMGATHPTMQCHIPEGCNHQTDPDLYHLRQNNILDTFIQP
jgi:hypothetical protein